MITDDYNSKYEEFPVQQQYWSIEMNPTESGGWKAKDPEKIPFSEWPGDLFIGVGGWYFA